MADIKRVPVVAKAGDKMVCPGCGERIKLTDNGWRNNRGYTCNPAYTTHSMHIDTLEARL